MSIDIEKLIFDVRKYENICDQERSQYKDFQQKDRIFRNEISKAMMGGENGKFNFKPGLHVVSDWHASW